LAGIAANLTGESFPSTVGSIWNRIAAEGTPFEGLSFQSISEEGNLLDGSAFDALPFVEGKSLHFEPKQETVAAE